MNEIQTIEPQVTISLDCYKVLLEKEGKLKELRSAFKAYVAVSQEYRYVVDKLLQCNTGEQV